MRGIAIGIAGGFLALCAATGAAARTAPPTGTPVTPRCIGDCDGSQSVSLNEVIVCVRVALDADSLSVCPMCDADDSGTVLINDIQSSVVAALTGCSSDPFEPDNSPDTARPIACGESLQRELTPDDSDYMTLSLPALTGIRLTTSGTGGDPFMVLYDSAVREIEAVNDHLGPFPYIDRICGANALPAGAYLVRMYNLSSDSSRYAIDVECTPCSVANPTTTRTPSATPTPTGDAFEPDNSIDRAAPIGCGEVQRHSFGPESDEDWSTFTIATRSTVHVFADPSQNELELHRADGTPLEAGYGSIYRDCGVDALEAGTYATRARGYNLRRYSLALTCAPCGSDNPTVTPTPTYTPTPTMVQPDADEEDDSRDDAVAVSCGAALSRSLAPIRDSDWLALDVAERSSVVVSTFTPFGAYLRLALQDGTGRDLEDAVASLPRECGVDPLEPGRYFIEVYADQPFRTPYDLLVSCDPCSLPNPPTRLPTARTPTPTPLAHDAYEPDDTPAEARPLACGELQSHTLHVSHDEDWTRFTLAAGSAVMLSTTNYGTLFRENGDLVTGVATANWTCADPLAAGTYHLRTGDGGHPGSYNVALLCAPCGDASPTPSPTPSATPLPAQSA